MDGKWNCVSYDGVAQPSGYSSTIEFMKSKRKEGTGTFTSTYTVAGQTYTGSSAFSYVLDGDKLTVTSAGDVEILTITDHSKTKLSWTDKNGKTAVLEKI